MNFTNQQYEYADTNSQPRASMLPDTPASGKSRPLLQPNWTGYMANIEDALLLLTSARAGLLQEGPQKRQPFTRTADGLVLHMVPRRMSSKDQIAITSGAIYIFEEVHSGVCLGLTSGRLNCQSDLRICRYIAGRTSCCGHRRANWAISSCIAVSTKSLLDGVPDRLG